MSNWPVYGNGTLKNVYDATQSTSYFVTSWTKHKKEGADFLRFLHTPAQINAWYAATGVPPADDRFARRRSPRARQAAVRLNTTGPQVWLQNFFPPQVDLNGNVPAQQLIFGGRATVPRRRAAPAGRRSSGAPRRRTSSRTGSVQAR